MKVFTLVRFAPSNLVLAIHELDETHIGRFSFRTRESFFQVCANSMYSTWCIMTAVFLAEYFRVGRFTLSVFNTIGRKASGM